MKFSKKVKKNTIVIFFLILSFFIYLSFLFKINPKIYFFLNKFFPSEFSSEKILMIESEFELKTFNNLLDKLKTAENSVILLLPQIFNIKVGDYLENINIEEIKKNKDYYNAFIYKIAEMPNLIPVIFLYNEKDKKSTVDLSKYFYFEKSDQKFNLTKYNYIKIISKKLWYSISDVAFYEEFDEYPFEISLLYDYNNKILLNAALESIRRYYKIPKTQVKYENKNLIIGNIVSLPMDKDGKMFLKEYKKYKKIYTAEEILNIEKNELNDKIIIIKSSNNTIQTMQSLAVAIDSLLNKKFIKYNKKIEYILAVVLAIILFFTFGEIKFLFGLILNLFFIFVELIIAAYLTKYNIYFDYMLFISVLFSLFFSVYLIKILSNWHIYKSRKNLMIKYAPPEKIKQIINQNIDIKIKNAWLKTRCFYIVFNSNYFSNPEKLKITFEKIKAIIYNNIYNCLIKINSFNEFLVVFLEEMDLKKEIDLLFEIRKSIEETNYNIIINNTEIYFLEYNNNFFFIDKRYDIKIQADKIEKRGYILIHGDDIQKYINLIKFQKVQTYDKDTFFNAISDR